MCLHFAVNDKIKNLNNNINNNNKSTIVTLPKQLLHCITAILTNFVTENKNKQF